MKKREIKQELQDELVAKQEALMEDINNAFIKNGIQGVKLKSVKLLEDDVRDCKYGHTYVWDPQAGEFKLKCKPKPKLH